MFVDPVQLVRWIGISAELDPQPGGRFRFEVMPGEYCEGAYVVVDRPRRLVFTWGWTNREMGVPPGSSRVEVTLRQAGADPARTEVRLVHSGLTGGALRLHEDGWTRFLQRLSAVMAGLAVPAYASETPQERLEALGEERT